MDNNDQDKTVIVERETPERSTNPLGIIVGVVVLIIAAMLAYNFFMNGNDTTNTGTNTETSLPAPNTTTPAPTE